MNLLIPFGTWTNKYYRRKLRSMERDAKKARYREPNPCRIVGDHWASGLQGNVSKLRGKYADVAITDPQTGKREVVTVWTSWLRPCRRLADAPRLPIGTTMAIASV